MQALVINFYFGRNFDNTVRAAHKSSLSEVFLRKGILVICCKFTGERPCQSAISIKISLRHGCSPVDLLHIFRTLFFKNASGRLLLNSTNFIKWEILILILTIHEQNMISQKAVNAFNLVNLISSTSCVTNTHNFSIHLNLINKRQCF